MHERTVRLFPQANGESFGLLPVPVDQKPGDYTLELLDKAAVAVATTSIQVIDGHFPKQNVVFEARLAELKPSPGETEMVTAFRNAVSELRYWSEPFRPPVPGCITSPFGVQRYINGKPAGTHHGGIDQRSAAGTPVHAVSGGVVKIAREWNLRGRTVGIDHGQGLETMYFHMSKLTATEGDIINKGDIVGYVGSTGRATAPHLHWSLYANGLSVNPLDWVQVPPCERGKS